MNYTIEAQKFGGCGGGDVALGQFAFNDGELFCLNCTERHPFRMAPHNNIIVIIIDMANTEYNNIE